MTDPDPLPDPARPGPPDEPLAPPYGALPAQPEYGQPAAYGQPPAYGQPGYAQPGYGLGYGIAHGGATTSMVLGIVSIAAALIGTCLCFFLGVVGALVGPFGIWQAVSANRDIKAAPERYNNAGNATAGLVCSIIGTVLGVLVLVATIVVVGIYGAVLWGATTY
jgi:hypothetical protein